MTITTKQEKPSEIVLKVEKLRKEFGGIVAVKEVSFEIKKGEFVGLIGPNGCGKSTTFNCISGLLNQTSGNVAGLWRQMRLKYVPGPIS